MTQSITLNIRLNFEYLAGSRIEATTKDASPSRIIGKMKIKYYRVTLDARRSHLLKEPRETKEASELKQMLLNDITRGNVIAARYKEKNHFPNFHGRARHSRYQSSFAKGAQTKRRKMNFPGAY